MGATACEHDGMCRSRASALEVGPSTNGAARRATTNAEINAVAGRLTRNMAYSHVVQYVGTYSGYTR